MLRRFHRFDRLLLLFILLGFLASLVCLARRYASERSSRAVALVLDYSQLRSLASATGVPLSTALRRFHAVGITGVALTEPTLGDLRDNGALEVVSSAVAGGREYRLQFGDAQVGERAGDYARHLAQGAATTPPAGDRVALPSPGGGTVYLPGRFEDLRLTPAGLDPTAVQQVRAADLEPVARINNPLGLTAPAIQWDLDQVQKLGARVVIFAGEEVMGYRGLIDETALAFQDAKLLYGSVEFGKQRGDERLSELLVDRMVRVHSIASAEMPRLTPGEAIERYVRAAVERNIRVVYVRLPAAATAQTFDDNEAYVHELARQTSHAGLGIHSPRLFPRVWPEGIVGRIAPAIVGFGVGAAGVLLLACLVPVRRRMQLDLGFAVGIVCALLVLSGKTLGLQLVALLSAVVFPSLAFLLYLQPVGPFEDGEPPLVEKPAGTTPGALVEFLGMSAITLVGALMLAAVLSHIDFMLKVRSFAGIKVATIVPVLLVGWVYLTGMHGEYRNWRAERDAIKERLDRFLSEPVLVWHTIAFIAAVVVLALVVARSGNDPGVGVSDTELRFRALLDRTLGVRPRTKEFLFGHPALLVGLLFAAAPRWKRLALPLVLIGTIGQVGMLNSFCHLHSPLRLTLLRTVHGLWTGALIGLVAYWVWTRLQGVERKRPERRRV